MGRLYLTENHLPLAIENLLPKVVKLCSRIKQVVAVVLKSWVSLVLGGMQFNAKLIQPVLADVTGLIEGILSLKADRTTIPTTFVIRQIPDRWRHFPRPIAVQAVTTSRERDQPAVLAVDVGTRNLPLSLDIPDSLGGSGKDDSCMNRIIGSNPIQSLNRIDHINLLRVRNTRTVEPSSPSSALSHNVESIGDILTQ
jgi:hypothetical protein